MQYVSHTNIYSNEKYPKLNILTTQFEKNRQIYSAMFVVICLMNCYGSQSRTLQIYGQSASSKYYRSRAMPHQICMDMYMYVYGVVHVIVCICIYVNICICICVCTLHTYICVIFSFFFYFSIFNTCVFYLNFMYNW